MQNALLQVQRDQIILQRLREQGVATVRALSEACIVTEVTIRRDLQRLESQGLLIRTYGGATLIDIRSDTPIVLRHKPNFVQEIDVLIMTYARTQRSHLLLEQARQRGLPIIAESEMIDKAQYVGIDHFQASFALGKWVAQNIPTLNGEPRRVLDVTYYFPHTRERSQAFMEGLTEHLPSAQRVLSVDGQALKSETYMLVKDALAVHPEINLIFAINDDSALGALEACRDMGRKPADIQIMWVGLDGATTRQLLAEGTYLVACVAMFPEVVARIVLSAALNAEAHAAPDTAILTPTAILTRENLTEYYQPQIWDTMQSAMFERLTAPYLAESATPRQRTPKRIGFVLPFSTHDWYRTITHQMARYAEVLNIELIVEDATASPHAELAWLAQSIAQLATTFIEDGDTLLLDHNPICLQIAQQFPSNQKLTVITNSVAILDTLSGKANITLIVTGGELHANGQALVGRVAEFVISEYRATKAFIGLAGISEVFGLTAPDHSLAQIQHAMIAAAGEIFLLADHTRIGGSGQAKIMKITESHTFITDAGISASDRLAFNRLGMRVVSATS